jgi:hypothetical protein
VRREQDVDRRVHPVIPPGAADDTSRHRFDRCAARDEALAVFNHQAVPQTSRHRATMMTLRSPWRRSLASATLALSLLTQWPAQAHGDASAASSALSILPVAVSVAAPVMIVASGAALTVVAVEQSAQGAVWVLERASDGARASLHFAGHASAAAGTAIAVTAVATGWVLSAAGAAIAFIPNELGRALLHDERITR